jgi:hypothetical protein
MENTHQNPTTTDTPENTSSAYENSERRALWTLLEDPKPSLTDKLEAAFPTIATGLRELCMGGAVQTLLSYLFPLKDYPKSPLGLTLSCRGYDRFTKEYLQETWLERQLYPCHQQDILWRASSQPTKASQLA